MRTGAYFRVPNFTGYGEEFETFAAAEAHARSQLRGSEFTRAFVDLRVGDAAGDRAWFRWEVYSDGRVRLDLPREDDAEPPVLPGPAGHWYARVEGEYACLPMDAEDLVPPRHPEVSDDYDGWGSVDDPAGDPAEDEAVRRALGVAA